MHSQDDPTTKLVTLLYRLRWPLSLLVFLTIGFAASTGFGRIGGLTGKLTQLGDNAGGLPPQPLLFDPRMEIWFASGDPAVGVYEEIEEQFVAEDAVFIVFEETQEELGVFSRGTLQTTARLTEQLLKVPGVRHVRSLTAAPWIRFGAIDGGEDGLIVSDLVDLAPDEIPSLTDDDLVLRMVAVLGATGTAEKVGESRVRAILGPDADFADHIGEPLMLGAIVNAAASVTAIQVQVLRGRVDEKLFEELFPEGSISRASAPALYSVQTQHRALRGIEHILRAEQGWAVPTEDLARLEQRLVSLPPGEERDRLAFELSDPSRNFIASDDGTPLRKYFEYEPDGAGGWVDTSDLTNPVTAPTDFTPAPSSPYSFHLGGTPHFERNFLDVGTADQKYMGMVMMLLVLVLAVMFRSVLGVVGPMMVVFGSIMGMIGVVFSFGDLLNNLTAIAPNLVIAVGIADSVHLVAAFSKLRHQYDTRQEIMVEVLRRNALPVLLTTLTTCVGFFSLTVSDIQPVGQLGYTAGIGALFAYALSMTVIPALLSLAPVPKRKSPKLASTEPGPLSNATADFVLARRGPILTVSAALVGLTVVGMWNFRLDTDFRAMFPDDNEVMTDFHWIESRLGGVGDVSILFSGLDQPADAEELRRDREWLESMRLQELGSTEHPDEFQPLNSEERAELAGLENAVAAAEAGRIAARSDFYQELERYEARLLDEMADPESPIRIMTDLSGPLDVLRKVHQVQNENRGTFYRVPGEQDVAVESRADRVEYDEFSEEWSLTPGQDASSLIAQYFLQFENSARPGESLSTQISSDRRSFRMQGRTGQTPTSLQIAAFERMVEIAEEEFPRLSGSDDASGPAISNIDVSGKTVLFSRTPLKFTIGFLESMGLALVLITLLIGVIFRSLWIALVSIVPNLLPILLPLSYFGLTGAPLDGPTILVASVALGVCVDDTIHLFAKFTKARRSGMDMRSSLVFSYDRVGRAITATTVVLVIGFAALMLSDFRPNYMMGTLATVMFFLAWVCDILVTPALLSYLPGNRGSGEASPAGPAA